MELSSLFKNATPLCFLPNGILLCYRKGKMLLLQDGKEFNRYSISKDFKERYLCRCRFVTRLLRLGVRAAIALDNQHVLISRGNRIFELNLEYGTLSEGWACGEGIRPLQFSDVQGIKGFDDGIYFGGYIHNHDKMPVSIYHRKGPDIWEVVYTFEQGTINHVHNVVSDPYRQCLWIFTGDFGEAAAIWKVTEHFKKVERIAGGDQRWRGSVVFVLPEGLLYATDTPRADDYLYLLNPDTMEQKEVMPLHGSCIYGCQWKDNYVLASTVECDGGDMSFFEQWFGRKRGKGIKDEYVHMYCGNFVDGFREIYKEKKDRLPFTLFQFGVFKFPSGVNNTDTLYFQPVATVKNDMSLIAIHNEISV